MSMLHMYFNYCYAVATEYIATNSRYENHIAYESNVDAA